MAEFHRARPDRLLGVLRILGVGELDFGPRDPHLVDPAPLGVDDFDAQPVDVEPLADRRDAADMRQEKAADGFESLPLDRHPQPLHDFVDVDLAAEQKAPVPFVDDRLGFDVVLVADLADDFLEQVLGRDEARRPAVLVDHDGTLRLLPLEHLEQLGHPLGLGDDERRPQQAGNRPRIVGDVEEDQILDEHEAGDVVEALLEHGKPRVLLFAEQRAQFADGGRVPDRDDIGARRHHLAHQRVAEIDDALEKLSLLALDDSLLLAGVEVRRRGLLGIFAGLVGLPGDRRPLRARDGPGDQPRNGTERAGNGRKGRQQELEHPLGIAADNCERQQQLADAPRTPRPRR